MNAYCQSGTVVILTGFTEVLPGANQCRCIPILLILLILLKIVGLRRSQNREMARIAVPSEARLFPSIYETNKGG